MDALNPDAREGKQPATQEEEVEVVRKALSLETAIQVEEAAIALLKGQEFERFPAYERVFQDTPPARPHHQVAEPPQPVVPALPAPPKSNYSPMMFLKANPIWLAAIGGSFILAVICGSISGFTYSSLATGLFFLCGAAFPICVIASLYFWNQERRRQDGLLANSPGYLQAVNAARQQAAVRQAQLESEAKQEQARLDAQYNTELRHYETVLLPAFQEMVAKNQQEYAEMRVEYEADKAEWEADRGRQIAELEADVTANKQALEELYVSSRIISLHYREIPILEWLYDDMRTSNHDIRYATELLDRDRQRIVTEQAGEKVTRAVDRLREQMHSDALAAMQLQGVQIQSLQRLEGLTADILETAEVSYDQNRKILFHMRANTADIAAREWRRRKALKESR